jgi:hypothetical protein
MVIIFLSQKDPFTTSGGSEFEQYSDTTRHQYSATQQEQVIKARRGVLLRLDIFKLTYLENF